MKAKITAKSELRLSDLTREYTFDILSDEGEAILTSQVIESQPGNVITQIQAKVSEYQAVYEDANDVEVGQEV